MANITKLSPTEDRKLKKYMQKFPEFLCAWQYVLRWLLLQFIYPWDILLLGLFMLPVAHMLGKNIIEVSNAMLVQVHFWKLLRSGAVNIRSSQLLVLSCQCLFIGKSDGKGFQCILSLLRATMVAAEYITDDTKF